MTDSFTKNPNDFSSSKTMADLIISPMEPRRCGYDSHQKVLDSISAFKHEVTDPMTGKSYVVADLLFLGNRVKYNTSSSRAFVGYYTGKRIAKFGNAGEEGGF